ncbi:MAG: M28 family peptidase [Candidatus Aminicenantes bacterium]|nr:M28 family peptidase [Candidatus Aminicenantes bacterium]
MKKFKIINSFRLIMFLILMATSFTQSSFPQKIAPQTQNNSSLVDFEKLVDAWDKGDYLVALKGFEQIISGSIDETTFERIALLTGSLFKVIELAPDGRNPRFSPDGHYLAIDFGPREDSRIRIYKTSSRYEKIAEIKGTKGVFSPTSHLLAYLQVPESEAIVKLRKELAQLSAATSDRAKLFNLQAQLSFLEAKEARLTLRDLRSGQEWFLDKGSLLIGEFVFSSDGTKIYLVGSFPEETGSTQIYSLSLSKDANSPLISPITQGTGYKTNPSISFGDRYLIYQTTMADPFGRSALTPRSPSDSATLSVRQAQQGLDESPPGWSFGQFGRQPVRSFSVVDLARGQIKTFEGTSAIFSPQGDSLAYLGREGSDNFLAIVKLEPDLPSIILKKTSASMASPAYSPDGKRLALEISVDGNNEIFIIDLLNKNEQRISREIQPDRQPRFLSDDKVVAIKGEARHSRAYLYDLRTGRTIRLFHNETIRTIAPEYEWAFHPEGKAVVIVADYDGDTISPERGVYLIDFSYRISKNDLLTRIKKQYELEAALKAKAEEFIRPLAPQIKKLIAEVSRRRLYEYQKTLFDFESKHVTQPGNLKAIEFLHKTLASFGYEPELQWLPDKPNKTANVVAVLKGKENPELYYVLSSHFDSVARGAGADDNSSSTAVLLETARILAKHPLPSSLILAAFTGEESGFWGSREFTRLAKERNLQILGAINNDTIGWTEDHRLDNTIRYANSGLRDLMHAASIGFSRMVTYETRYIRATDAVPLYEAFGNIVAGLGSHPVLGNPYYHTPLDRLEVINQELIEEATKFMIATVVMMASSPSPVRNLNATIREKNLLEVSWSPNPEKGIDHYLVTFELDNQGPLLSQKVKATQALIRLDKLIQGLPKARKADQKLTLKISVKAKNRLGLPSWDDSTLWLKLN